MIHQSEFSSLLVVFCKNNILFEKKARKIFCFEKYFYICTNDCASFTIQFALILNTHYYVGITPQAPSGVALINVDKKGENCIVVASGANGTLSVDDIQRAESTIKQASIVIMQLETPIESVTYAAKMAKKDGITVILNPAPAPTQQLPDDLLANVDILIPNVTEAEIISGMHITDDESAKEAIRYISSKGIKTVIITMGAKGALAYENNKFTHIPAFKVEAVDTTAAGDTFCGGLCVALSEGKNLKDAIIFASKASSISVTRMGAQVSIPLRKEIQ